MKTISSIHHIIYANSCISLDGSITKDVNQNTIVAKGTIEKNNDVAMLGVLGYVLDQNYTLKSLRYNKSEGELYILATKKSAKNTTSITITETSSDVVMC